MINELKDRRRFLKQLIGAPLAGQAAFGTLAGLAASPVLAADNEDYRALVCVFLLGGNDSFNMIIPSSDTAYNQYALARQNLAVARSSLISITPVVRGGVDYGVHPAMPELQSLFNTGDLAVVANVGALVEPTTRNDILNNSVKLPPNLFSHNAQRELWQGMQAYEARNIGWAGRLADQFSNINTAGLLPMNVSMSGENLLQFGAGARSIDADTLFSSKVKTALSNTTKPVTSFDDNEFANSLKAVAHTIAARSKLGMQRQIFFVGFEGWDTHDNQIEEHSRLLARLSGGLNSFNAEMRAIGCHDNVTTFTASDFGRTLTSNGAGSDHGWGGHQLIMGGAVAGQNIHGNMPAMVIDGPQDAGGGRIIPDSSVDQYGASIARWFGVPENDLDLIFPNLLNFDRRDLGLFV